MEEKKNLKISLSTILFIFAVIIIIIMAVCFFKVYNDKKVSDDKVSQLNSELSNLNQKVNVLEQKNEKMVIEEQKKIAENTKVEVANNVEKKASFSIEGKYVNKDELEISQYTFENSIVTFEQLYKYEGTYEINDSKIKITYTKAFDPEGNPMNVTEPNEELTIVDNNTLKHINDENGYVSIYEKENEAISKKETTVDSNEIKYIINTKENSYGEKISATIEATKNGRTISKEIETTAIIDRTGVTEIDGIGKVALISESGGEYLGIRVFQLVNNEIKELGVIGIGANVVSDVEYSVNQKGEASVVISATEKKSNKKFEKQIDMSAEIDKINVINMLDYGNVVLVSETGGEYYGIKAYGLTQDYATGELKDIVEIGTLTGMF